MRYYIIAGERSGDLHGGNLVKALRQRDAQAEFRGFGGEYMQQAGVEVTVHYNDMAFMGLAEILKNMRKIAFYIKRCKEDILAYKPDVIILIDYGGFNGRIAKFGKENNLKVFYYIPPKVWAWYQNRALKLKATVDRMFVILPFEKPFFKKFGWDVDYVGNPVLDAIKAHTPDHDFLSKHKFRTTAPLIALLPGSRKQELKRIIPLMAEVVKRFPDHQFGLAGVSNLDQSLYIELMVFHNVKFILEDTYNLLLHSNAAIVTSGTATLETALWNVPQVVVYKTSELSYWPAKWLVRVPYISLVNLIADREVVKEMIQSNATTTSVSVELKRLLVDKEYRQGVLDGYKEIRAILDTGSASENTARLMVGYLNEKRQ